MTRKIFFNEAVHKYTDDMDNVYTSTTTMIGKYHKQFDREKEALRCSRKYFNKKGHKYYRMMPNDILKLWEKITEVACDRGNDKHDYLEGVVKKVTGYNRSEHGHINDRIYTVDDILIDHNYGRVDIEYFESIGLNEKYPEIYNVLLYHAQNGFYLYAEIGVYDYANLVSGLIDILAVDFEKKVFRVLDWKTNKGTLYFKAGYIKNDRFGNPTGIFVETDERMNVPLAHIDYCKGSIYTLQLSLYAYLVELMSSFKCTGIYLCHIGHDGAGTEYRPEWHNIAYWQSDVKMMIKHHFAGNYANLNQQTKLVI